MVILRTRNKITDYLMILAWASPFNATINEPRGMTGLPNFAVGPVTPTAILYPQPSEKLGYHEIGTNISSAYENLAIFSRRKLVIFWNDYI